MITVKHYRNTEWKAACQTTAVTNYNFIECAMIIKKDDYSDDDIDHNKYKTNLPMNIHISIPLSNHTSFLYYKNVFNITSRQHNTSNHYLLPLL